MVSFAVIGCLGMMTANELAQIVTPSRLLAVPASVRDPSPHSDDDKPGGPVFVCCHILTVAMSRLSSIATHSMGISKPVSIDYFGSEHTAEVSS